VNNDLREDIEPQVLNKSPSLSSNDLLVDGSNISSFEDVHLIAQELANTGSSQSENQMSYLIDTFIASECYEWVFLLALVLKRIGLINEVMRKLIASELTKEVSANLRRGIERLDIWSQNEWYCVLFRLAYVVFF